MLRGRKLLRAAGTLTRHGTPLPLIFGLVGTKSVPAVRKKSKNARRPLKKTVVRNSPAFPRQAVPARSRKPFRSFGKPKNFFRYPDAESRGRAERKSAPPSRFLFSDSLSLPCFYLCFALFVSLPDRPQSSAQRNPEQTAPGNFRTEQSRLKGQPFRFIRPGKQMYEPKSAKFLLMPEPEGWEEILSARKDD